MFTEPYRLLNKKLHESNAEYGTAVKIKLEIIKDLIKVHNIRTVLDYGCGKGELNKALHTTPNLYICEYDIAFDDKLNKVPCELVVCSDVMEHVEQNYTEEVIADIALHTTKVAWFCISCKESDKNLPDGRNAHINIKPSKEWLALLEKHFEIKSSKLIPNRNEIQVLCTKRFK